MWNNNYNKNLLGNPIEGLITVLHAFCNILRHKPSGNEYLRWMGNFIIWFLNVMEL